MSGLGGHRHTGSPRACVQLLPCCIPPQRDLHAACAACCLLDAPALPPARPPARRYVDYQFTSDMEGQLDEVAGGRLQWRPMMEGFWHGFKDNTVQVAGLSNTAVRPAERAGGCGSWGVARGAGRGLWLWGRCRGCKRAGRHIIGSRMQAQGHCPACPLVMMCARSTELPLRPGQQELWSRARRCPALLARQRWVHPPVCM